MSISIIGAGYVGSTCAPCFAEKGIHTTCIDQRKDVVEGYNQGITHNYEPGLERKIKENLGKNLFFSNDYSSLKDSDIIFLCVGTPSIESGEEKGKFNLEYLESAARDVGKAIQGTKNKIIVTKSTVPQGTSFRLSNVLKQYVEDFHYVSNPETLAEGTAVADFMKPDRIIIGANSEYAFQKMRELYHTFVIRNDKILEMSPSDAELSKLYSNTALANKITMMNEFARIADSTLDADMNLIRRAVCSDSRIGDAFSYAGPGYGGSCFPKDLPGLLYEAEKRDENLSLPLLNSIAKSNELHKKYCAEKIFNKSENPKKICLWGVTFKPGTDDMRESPSIPIIEYLQEKGVAVSVYDPKDQKAKEIFGDAVTFCADKYEAAKDADSVVLLTHWQEFENSDYLHLRKIMKGNTFIDLRNRLLYEPINKAGFHYFGMGRNYPLSE